MLQSSGGAFGNLVLVVTPNDIEIVNEHFGMLQLFALFR